MKKIYWYNLGLLRQSIYLDIMYLGRLIRVLLLAKMLVDIANLRALLSISFLACIACTNSSASCFLDKPTSSCLKKFNIENVLLRSYLLILSFQRTPIIFAKYSRAVPGLSLL
jgi:hypothetical protein